MLFFSWLSPSESWTELEKHSHTSPPSNCEFIPSIFTFPLLLCIADTFDHFVPFLITCSLTGLCPASPQAEPLQDRVCFYFGHHLASGAPLPAGAARRNPGSKMYCWSSANKCKGEIMVFRRLFAVFAGGIRVWSQLQWSNQARFGSGLDWPHLSPF